MDFPSREQRNWPFGTVSLPLWNTTDWAGLSKPLTLPWQLPSSWSAPCTHLCSPRNRFCKGHTFLFLFNLQGTQLNHKCLAFTGLQHELLDALTAYSSSDKLTKKQQPTATPLPGICSLCPLSRYSTTAPLQSPGTEIVPRTPKTKVFRVWVAGLGLLWVWGFFPSFIMETTGFFLIQTCPCTAANCENGFRKRNSLNSTAINTCTSVDRTD